MVRRKRPPRPLQAKCAFGASERLGQSECPAQSVDVAEIVDRAAASKGEKLAWRTSIVDLMKALNLDSSITARKQLAAELNYTGRH